MTASYRRCSGVPGHGECGCTRAECAECGWAEDFATEPEARAAVEDHNGRAPHRMYPVDPWLVVYNHVTYGPGDRVPRRVLDALAQMKEERT